MKTSVQKFLLLPLAAFIFALAATAPALASPPAKFGGHYELADSKAGRSFSLDVKQTDDRATISFSAGMADGSGSAPDADGKGEIDDGILTFKFKDSYANEGTGTLEYKSGVYHLSMAITKVVDTGPLHFYGTMVLKQTR